MSGEAERRGSGAGRWWLAGAGLWWLAFFRPLSPGWSGGVEQAFAWAVPGFAAYFAWERCRAMPEAAPPVGRERALAWMALAWSVAAMPVVTLVLEANAGWPTAQWTGFAVGAVGLCAALWLAGGRAWVRHFAFPLGFATTALAWPAVVTTRLVAALVAMNAQLAALTVANLGHPAVVSGNVIEVATGFVGIDEACSGLRSLQAVWMAGWFFGELFRLGAGRRVALVGAALATAVVTNWMRTSALTWLAAAESIEASERWHDRAGALELAVTLAVVAGLAWRQSAGAGRVVVAGKGAGLVDARPIQVLAGAGLVALLAPVGWYSWHEFRSPGRAAQWRLESPGGEWRPWTVPPAAVRLLGAGRAEGLADGPPGAGPRAFALAIAWDGGLEGALAGRAHDPSICLPAAGHRMTPAAEETLELEGRRVEFQAARFEAEGRPGFVFYCHWDGWLGRARRGAVEDIASFSRWRLERVVAGRRGGEAAYLAFVVPAAEGDEARAWLRAWAPRLLRPR